LAEHAASLLPTAGSRGVEVPLKSQPELAMNIRTRPSRLCTGCPERPFFASMKLLQRELGTVMRDSP
jgi:indolepyruvate ferredoxin oxidoreductase, alpha subunit